MLLILFSAKCQTLLSFTALYSTKWTKAADEPPRIPPGAAAADHSVLPTESPAKSCAFWEPTRRTMNGLRHKGEVLQGLGAGSRFLLTLSGVWEKNG